MTLYRWAKRGVLTLAGLTVLMGALHLPWGQDGRSAASKAAGCPFGGKSAQMSPAEKAAHQQARRASLQGEGIAPSTAFFGLTLGQSTRPELEQWAALRGLRCAVRGEPSTLECKTANAAPVASHLAAAQSTTFFAQFDADNVVSQIRLIAMFPEAAGASSAMQTICRDAQTQVGAPSLVQGEAEGEFLRSALWQQARTEYRRQNLYVKVSATNLGDKVALTQHVEVL